MVSSTGLLYSLDLGQAHCQAQEIFWERLYLDHFSHSHVRLSLRYRQRTAEAERILPTDQPPDQPKSVTEPIYHSLYPISYYISLLIITNSRPTDSSLPPSLSLNPLLTLSLPPPHTSYSTLSSLHHTPMGRRKIDIQPLTVSRIPTPDASSPLILLQNERNRLVTFQKVSQAWSSPSSRLAHLYCDRLLFWVPSLCRDDPLNVSRPSARMASSRRHTNSASYVP